MVRIRKYANSVERFLHGRNGQRFFNFAYSIGAAIVIWGALFKILHLPGGNFLLCLGMGTEVAMFILTAFDRPPKEYNWEYVYPELDPDADHTDEEPRGKRSHRNAADAPDAAHSSGAVAVSATPGLQPAPDLASASAACLETMNALALQMQRLQQTTQQLNEVSAVLLDSYRAITENSENISQSSHGYVDQMEALNRNIAGLNTIYEIQLKSVSGQIETIDRVNRSMKDIRDMYEKSATESGRYSEETERMARYMRQLNAVYEKMITAMTINMQNPMMGNAPAQNPYNTPASDPFRQEAANNNNANNF